MRIFGRVFKNMFGAPLYSAKILAPVNLRLEQHERQNLKCKSDDEMTGTDWDRDYVNHIKAEHIQDK